MSASLSRTNGSRAHSPTASFTSHDSFKTSRKGPVRSLDEDDEDNEDDGGSDGSDAAISVAASEASMSSNDVMSGLLFEKRIKDFYRRHDNVVLEFAGSADSTPTFYICPPRTMLVQHSGYFRTLLKQSDQIESHHLKFDDDELIPMEVFLLWVESGQIYPVGFAARASLHAYGRRYLDPEQRGKFGEVTLPFIGAEFISLWHFAAHLEAPCFQNDIMRSLVEGVDKHPIEAAFDMYVHAESANKLFRKLMAYKAWFSIKYPVYLSFEECYRMVGVEAFAMADAYLTGYYRQQDQANPGRGFDCLMDHVEEFLIPV